MNLLDCFGFKKVVIGMIHLFPLPGTPLYENGNYEKSMEKALKDAKALYEGGADGCVIQTIDRVYNNGEDVDFARLVSLANIVQAVSSQKYTDFFIGVQILFNANKASLAVAKYCNGHFIRSATYVGSTNNSAGIATADPVGFQEYRAKINANHINVTAEVYGLHYKNIDKKGVIDLAKEAIQAGANIIETADPDELVNNDIVREIKDYEDQIPVYLGGYTNHENILRRIQNADGVFVGSCFQTEGWGGYIDQDRVKSFTQILRKSWK